MITILRHLLAIAILPFTVTVLVPLWIARRNGVVLRLGPSAAQLALQLAGVVVLGVGLFLFGASLQPLRHGGQGHPGTVGSSARVRRPRPVPLCA